MQIGRYIISSGMGDVVQALPRGSTILGVHDGFLVVHGDPEEPFVAHLLKIVGEDTDFFGIKAYRYLGCFTVEVGTGDEIGLKHRYVFERIP